MRSALQAQDIPAPAGLPLYLLLRVQTCIVQQQTLAFSSSATDRGCMRIFSASASP